MYTDDLDCIWKQVPISSCIGSSMVLIAGLAFGDSLVSYLLPSNCSMFAGHFNPHLTGLVQSYSFLCNRVSLGIASVKGFARDRTYFGFCM
jgi:hypothetical protein